MKVFDQIRTDFKDKIEELKLIQTILNNQNDFRYNLLKNIVKEINFQVPLKKQGIIQKETKKLELDSLFDKLNSRFQKSEEKMDAKFVAIEERQNEMLGEFQAQFAAFKESLGK